MKKTALGIIPAQSIEIENALLRNIITVGASAIDQVANQLRSPELFYKTENIELYKIIMKLYRSNQTVDVFTIQNAINENDALQNYVIDLITDSTSANISVNTNADYINILQQKYVKRRAVEAFYEFQKELFDPLISDTEGFYSLEKAYQQMVEIIQGRQQIQAMPDVVQKSIEDLKKRIEIRQSGKLPGVDTGLKQLNYMIAGWQQGELYVIAARPGMGKTALMLFFAEQAARNGHHVLFFSLEMSNRRLTDRLIIGEAELLSGNYHHGNINHLELESITAKANDLAQLPIHFDDKSGVDVDYIVASSRIAKRKHDIKLIIIDYLQLIDFNEKRGQTRDAAIGEVTRKLKTLSKDLEVPVIIGSQLNRSLEGRATKEPTLADLRESGNIEQDADVVLMLFRPAYYQIDNYKNRETDRVLWILTQKYRDGNKTDIIIEHNDTLTKFYNRKDGSTTDFVEAVHENKPRNNQQQHQMPFKP